MECGSQEANKHTISFRNGLCVGTSVCLGVTLLR